jgi:arylsulfatase A-like enzyme
MVGLPDVDPAVTIMWLTDPDTTAHDSGIGAPETTAALKALDGEIKRLLDGLTSRGILDNFDIWVTSDHGFSTYTGAPAVASLRPPAAGTSAVGAPPVVSGGGAVYVRDHDRATIARIVADLQRTPGIGAIFTPAAARGSFDGAIAGTLSFEAAHWQHERSADILYSPDWTDARNAFGYPGTTASGGTAGHGSSSPFDIHNTLIAAGPDVKRRTVLQTPSGNVDFAPTFLTLLGLRVPSAMQGRVLDEAFANSTTTPRAAMRSMKHSVSTPDRGYAVDAFFSIVDVGAKSYRYLDRTVVTRAAR